VYIESTEQGDEGLEGGSRVGAVNAWGGLVGGHQVTAVGEVPQKTVRLVIESLEQVAVD
jgi:sigma-E factor negative regulatory protein RseB